MGQTTSGEAASDMLNGDFTLGTGNGEAEMERLRFPSLACLTYRMTSSMACSMRTTERRSQSSSRMVL